jgi:predicted ATPase
MLETIRELALERLAESGQEADLLRRHAAYLLRLAEETAPKLLTGEQTAWLDRLIGSTRTSARR